MYGSEYNASHYLARFLKVSLNLQMPDAQGFVENLMDSDPVAVSDWRIISGPVESSKEAVSRWLADLFIQSGLSARDIERVMDNMLLATRIREDRYPVQLAALAPLAVIDYLKRIGKNPGGTLRFLTPVVQGVEGSESLYDDIMRRKTGATSMERVGTQAYHVEWIKLYASDYVNSVRKPGSVELGMIKLPHIKYSRLLGRIGPRTYGDEKSTVEVEA